MRHSCLQAKINPALLQVMTDGLGITCSLMILVIKSALNDKYCHIYCDKIYNPMFFIDAAMAAVLIVGTAGKIIVQTAVTSV